MSEIAYPTMNTPDDQERVARRAQQIARGRWLTLFVVVVALGGPLMELLYRLSEPGAGNPVTYVILLIAVAIVTYLLYKGHPWGKRGLIYFLGYMAISEGLGVLIAFVQTMQLVPSGSATETWLVGLVMVLISAALLAIPIAALVVLWRSDSVAAYLETRQ